MSLLQKLRHVGAGHAARLAALPRPGRRQLAAAAVIALLAGAGGFAYWRGTHPSDAQSGGRYGSGGRAQPVGVATVALGDLPVWVNAIGTVVPRTLVTVRSRVDGELFKVHFTEGQLVKAGDLLAEIDPRPLTAQLQQAQGQLQKDLALLHNAELDLQRYQTLWAQDSVTRQQLDTQAALVGQYRGAVATDRGAVDNAKVQLTYARITAPTAGRVGLRQVDPGNQVRAADVNGIVSIAQLAPITVVFAIPQQHLPALSARIADPAGQDSLAVEAWDAAQQQRIATGKLLSADNQVDVATGTIKLKAEFDNRDRTLFPNQFVNARLLLQTWHNVKLIPDAGLQRGASGTFVYAVDPAGVVSIVPITVLAASGGLVAIDGALAPGVPIVVDGADKLRAGAKVQFSASAAASAPSAAVTPR